jgi:hypothetical protein
MTYSLTRNASRPADAVRGTMIFFVTIVVIQGIHVIEHILQLVQVYVLGVPDDDAFGLLGYVFAIQGTEEWLHLVFNVWYLASLYIVFIALWRAKVLMQLPSWVVATYVVLGLGLESWHVIEHAVIITNVVKNSGCPCPGIGDRVLGLTDTVLHFGYNAVAFAGTLVLFWHVRRLRPSMLRRVNAATA